MRHPTRVNKEFLEQQTIKRKNLETQPGQAGGLPALNERVEVIESILALHSYALPAQP